jgi:putative ATP-dependent endonuclease of OLD family
MVPGLTDSILVEGVEDVAFITTELQLSGLRSEFRKLGCHIISVNGKGKLLEPLAVAIELGMPAFVVFDADGDTERPDHRIQHEKDNTALMTLIGVDGNAFPAANLGGSNYAIWQTNLTKAVKLDFPEAEYGRLTEPARQHYAQEGGLKKTQLFIADWLSSARNEHLSSTTLTRLCQSILSFARNI